MQMHVLTNVELFKRILIDFPTVQVLLPRSIVTTKKCYTEYKFPYFYTYLYNNTYLAKQGKQSVIFESYFIYLFIFIQQTPTVCWCSLRSPFILFLLQDA